MSQTFRKVWWKPLLPVKTTASLTFPPSRAMQSYRSQSYPCGTKHSGDHPWRKAALHLVNNVYSKLFFIVTSFQTNQPTVADPSRLWHVSTLESDTRHSLGKTSSETHECLQGPKDTGIHCVEAPSNDSLTVWIFHPFIKIMTCSTQGWNGPPSIVNPVQESEMGQKRPASLLYCLGH